MISPHHPQPALDFALRQRPAGRVGCGVRVEFYADQVAGLPQYLLPVPGINRFLSGKRFFGFQRLLVFLGMHLRALVFYSDGERVSRQFSSRIGGFPESEAANGF